MRFKSRYHLHQVYIYILFSFFVVSCSRLTIRENYSLNSFLSQSFNNFREPSLGLNSLAILVNQNGREKIRLIDLKTRRVIALPGINRSDSQPISLSINSDGTRIAFISQREDQTELFVYRIKSARLQRLDLRPKGIPKRVSMNGSGSLLAVQVSRDGRWFIDFIKIPA